MHCMRVVRLKSNNRTESRVNDSLFIYLCLKNALYSRTIACGSCTTIPSICG